MAKMVLVMRRGRKGFGVFHQIEEGGRCRCSSCRFNRVLNFFGRPQYYALRTIAALAQVTATLYILVQVT